MEESNRKGLARIPPAVKGVAMLGFGWWSIRLIVGFLDALPSDGRGVPLLADWIDPHGALGAFKTAVNQALYSLIYVSFWDYGTVLAAASMLLPLGFVARTLARARVRAGLADPLDAVRRWTAAHPWGTSALFATMGAASVFFFGHLFFLDMDPWMTLVPPLPRYALFGAPALLGALGIYGAARAASRALLAPTLDAADAVPAETADGEITFNAVAVTREARMAVAGMALLPLAFAAAAVALDSVVALRALVMPLLLAYVAVALGGAAYFRRASRVAIGADGVFVSGTSRTRFYAYRDLDAARVTGSEIELVRRERVVLRLQLHGADAARRDVVLERIRSAIDGVKGGEGAAAQSLVEAASSAVLARAALGAGDFRQPAVSREALWKLVEGPSTDLAARTAAAEALASSLDPSERPRLRVAASQCAEPRARVALERLAELEGDDVNADTAPAQRMAR